MLGTAGAMFGGPYALLAAGAGSTGGEAIRKGIGKVAFDEPKTALENVTDMAVEGLMGRGGELVGCGVGRVINNLGARRGGVLARATGKDLPKLKLPQTK